MQFTQKEVALIARAGRKAKNAKFIRIFILIAMLVAIACMLMGALDTDKIAYFLLVAVFVSIAHPQLGDGPKYEDLVALLEQKQSNRTE